MTTWNADEPHDRVRIGPLGWAVAGLRGVTLGVVTYGSLMLLLALRLVEVPVFRDRRPFTPYVTQFVCRSAFVIMGIRYRIHGQPMRKKGAVVSNHASWLDIFTLNACQRIYFVSKSEVAKWPAIGWLARATGTVFIARDPRQAKDQQRVFEERLRAGHRLVFFPEGTSTDGLRVLPFKPTLFQAFYTHGLDHTMHIQPVSVVYHAPVGQKPRFYGWWGDMEFGPHFIKALAPLRQGRVEVIFHDPVAVDAFPSRKELAQYCEEVVRQGLESRLGPTANRTDRA
ncbi:1-acyl-sn-glycerol-3-phosphate acyltransferase [Defluviimonas sp. WL0002]|uniref:1-acyl-sn-glycerol-3-phosphate acyltransferase n=1 Tax=Albidovulum marisflavi TaxID=2984159 RepID=A0ABT2ZH41_9RHOB|nr:lysophospholipid acyltransferase family protein [Defluviimonas sp. WL0002]MCV2870426.1 1-acyl-sn-glycerol-3-phosphate acyltransferase [Defluviimonas sp. WL0002]